MTYCRLSACLASRESLKRGAVPRLLVLAAVVLFAMSNPAAAQAVQKGKKETYACQRTWRVPAW